MILFLFYACGPTIHRLLLKIIIAYSCRTSSQHVLCVRKKMITKRYIEDPDLLILFLLGSILGRHIFRTSSSSQCQKFVLLKKELLLNFGHRMRPCKGYFDNAGIFRDYLIVEIGDSRSNRFYFCKK